MWTIAAANKKLKGPLGTYNGLTDIHLAHYFSTPAKVTHLKEAKLITSDGLIIPDQKVKVESLQYEKKKKLYDLLAQSVIRNAAHREGSLNKRLHDYLEDVARMENVETIKVPNRKLSRNMSSAVRKKRASVSPAQTDNLLPYWLPDKEMEMVISLLPRSAPTTSDFLSKSQSVFTHSKLSKSQRCFSAIESSPYVIPLFKSNSPKGKFQFPLNQIFCSLKKRRKRKKKSANKEAAGQDKVSNSKKFSLKLFAPHLTLKQEECKITVLYHGHGPFTSVHSRLTEDMIIKQQHCGGTPVTVYKGQIAANEMATFNSLAHDGFPFSLTFFIDGIRYLKLSSCCVFRYPLNKRLGGSNGNFSIRKIEGGKRCLNCQFLLESESFARKQATHVDEEIHQISNLKLESGNNFEETTPDLEENQNDQESKSNTPEEDVEEEYSEDDSIKSEQVDENVSSVAHTLDVASDNIPEEEHFSGDPDTDSESSVISAAESVADDAAQVNRQTFQNDSTSDEENGKRHVVTASVHRSPS